MRRLHIIGRLILALARARARPGIPGPVGPLKNFEIYKYGLNARGINIKTAPQNWGNKLLLQFNNITGAVCC